jgi:hypothetical protein
MNNRSSKVLKALLSRCPELLRKALQRFLPDHERQFLEELPFFEETAPDTAYNQAGTLEAIHWSWIAPILQSHSLREQRLYLSALDPDTASRIAAVLDIPDRQDELTTPARSFLKEKLMKEIAGAQLQILSPDFLPTSKLNRLLLLNKKELIRIIDFLSLYDLSIEFRQIVETKILKKIYSFLSEDQKAFLQQINLVSEANPFGKLGLDRWDRTAETLRTLLHRRGLTRLSAALQTQDPDLVWTLCHKLDSGRGGALFKLCTNETSADTAENARRQLEELLEKQQ